MTLNPPELLTVRQVATILHCRQTSTVTALIRSGRLHAKFIGTKWLVPVEALHDLIANLPTISDGTRIQRMRAAHA